MNSKTIGSFLAAMCCLAYGCGDTGVTGAELETRSTGSGGAETVPCDSDADCPRGEECEFEHDTSFCKPHGGDDDRPADKPDPDAMECDSDADCPRGEECEFEHDMSFCKPHGGDDDDDDGDHDDDDDDGDHHDDDDDYYYYDDDDRSGSNSGKG